MLESNVFLNCYKLDKINIPYSVFLYPDVFDNCTNLKTVEISDISNLRGIGHFTGCKNLKQISSSENAIKAFRNINVLDENLYGRINKQKSTATKIIFDPDSKNGGGYKFNKFTKKKSNIKKNKQNKINKKTKKKYF